MSSFSSPHPPSSGRGALSALLARLSGFLRQDAQEAHRAALGSDLAGLRSALDPEALTASKEDGSRAQALRRAIAAAPALTPEGRALRQTLLHAAGAPSRLPPPLPAPAFPHARPARLLLSEAANGADLSFNLDNCSALVELMSHYRRQGLMRWPNPAAADDVERLEKGPGSPRPGP